jgi:hypothetical protein
MLQRIHRGLFISGMGYLIVWKTRWFEDLLGQWRGRNSIWERQLLQTPRNRSHRHRHHRHPRFFDILIEASFAQFSKSWPVAVFLAHKR